MKNHAKLAHHGMNVMAWPGAIRHSKSVERHSKSAEWHSSHVARSPPSNIHAIPCKFCVLGHFCIDHLTFKNIFLGQNGAFRRA